MGTQIQPWQPSTDLTLETRCTKAREILAVSTSAAQSLKAARQLVGLWPHAKPPDPETYAAGIAATLAGYPLGIVQECCDPRTGLARSREFPPTVAAIVEWCDFRLAFYRSLAAHNGRLMLVSERQST